MSGSFSVLAAVDFSEPSRQALEVATGLCVRSGASLELLHVWNANQLLGSGAVFPALQSSLAEQKQLLASRLEELASDAKRAGIDASCRVVEGAASRMIPELARASRAGLVVVGRRGAANLAHVLLGSVSERVVHLSPCPVLVVPEEPDANASAPERLLVGVDFSPASRDAYRVALRLAERVGASRGLLLVHARPGHRELHLPSGSELEGAYRGGYPYDAEALERWARLSQEARVPVEVQVLEGSTAPLLVDAARENGCDWLAVGVQGRTGLAALLVGGTTDRVLKLADRPVLVVPQTSEPAGEAI